MVTIAFATSASAYHFIVESYDSSLNLFSSFGQRNSKFKFYSGGPGGIYTNIGTALEEWTDSEDYFGGPDIKNFQTNGGSENAINVLTHDQAFGLVQEETIGRGDALREKLQYITPIYMERMHIIYRTANAQSKHDQASGMLSEQSFECVDLRFESEKTVSAPKSRCAKELQGVRPSLSTYSSNATLSLFREARISSGPVGSGTRVLASYMLDEINSQIRDRRDSPSENRYRQNCRAEEQGIGEAAEGASEEVHGCEVPLDPLSAQRTHSMKTVEAIEAMRNNRIDVMFSVAGAPVPEFAGLLESGEFGLVSISPSFVAHINRKYDINLRMSDFKADNVDSGVAENVYGPQFEDVATAGTYAYLIASSDVTSSEIFDFVHLLTSEETKQHFLTLQRSKVNGVEISASPLEEISVRARFESLRRGMLLDFFRNLLLFCTSVLLSTYLLMQVLAKFVSSRSEAALFRRLGGIQDTEYGPSIDETDPLKIRIGKERIRELLKELFEIEGDAFDDFQSGSLISQHFNTVIETVDRLKTRLRDTLAQHQMAHQAFEEVEVEELRRDFFDGFLKEEHFSTLSAQQNGDT